MKGWEPVKDLCTEGATFFTHVSAYKDVKTAKAWTEVM